AGPHRPAVASGARIKNVNIINNRFEGGHYHIHFYLYVIPISQLQITGNVFINYEDLGILVVHPENITVSQNSFNSQLGGAIQIREAAKNLIIEKNKGIDPGGFTFINCIDSTFANRTISNNMISGLFLSKSSYIDIFNNSIYALSKNNIPALCFGLNKVDHINHKNNIYSTDNGVSINGDNVSNFISDHNDYYSNSFTIARWETKELSTLQDFINITKTDSNSFSVDPLFVSNTDLHLKTCLLLDGKGDSNTGITTDIDEEMRQSPPDVGADEYTVVPHLFDAGISDIQMLPQNCSDTISLSVRIKNFATDTLHSVTIKLNLNDSITVSYDWTGALGQETKKEWIFLGKFFIGIGDIKVKSWTIYPDAQPDSQPLNDTTTINFGYLPLHGSYTAGNPSCFFPTVEKAISELKKHGICAPVVIKIADGTYTDQEELSGINGSLINTITFESLNQDSSKVLFINQSNTISFYVTEGTFLFKKIGFINKDTTSTYGKPFFMRTAKVGIENCYFRSITNAASCIETDATMRLNISSNYFYTETPRYKAASIHLDKPLTGEAKPNVMITNNTFDESVFAIYSQAADSLIIYGNRMNTSKAASLKAGTGITISAAKTIEISNNRISGDYITAVEIAIPASYGSYTGMVKNNFINTKGGALKCKDMQRLYLYYNTMNMDASDTAFTMMTFINCRDIIFKNNIVNSTGANKLLEADTVKG
ncbi:MAG TPA: right-handed parallel beta-helix repeat-containing protein, partial [Bacteroidia bacterium]|nr:right-handed parallel beta-helix repeat-containing protein [Bacteroidia bacterium]